jgi:hypothetical protein
MKDLNLTLGIKANIIVNPFGDISTWNFSDTRRSRPRQATTRRRSGPAGTCR